MNTLGEALKKAIDSSEDLKKSFKKEPFIWKGEKRKEGKKFVQTTEVIDDMTPERLCACYEHCKKMLNNTNPKHLGRYNVLEEVTKQINKCNVELFLRYCENSYLRREGFVGTPRFKLLLDIRSFIKESEKDAEEKDIELDWNTIPIVHLLGDLPAEFVSISIADAKEGCIDTLDALDKQHLTMSFIVKMGIWFTKAEENEIKGNSNVEKLKTVKEKLHLPSELNLQFNEKGGLSYREMRAILTLPKKQRYSDMTTEQLVTLRNKILPRLLKRVDGHIFSWNKLKKQIEIVAKSRNIKLNND